MTSPSAKTPIVWVTVTVAPRRTASRGFPFVPDEVARNERLAVAGREGVDGAPEGGDQETDQDDPEGQVTALDQRLEATGGVLGAGVSPIVAAVRTEAPGREVGRDRCGRRVVSARGRSDRPAARPSGSRPATDAPATRAPSRAVNDDLAPADAARERAVGERETRAASQAPR